MPEYALTLHQPWATLVVEGPKAIERDEERAREIARETAGRTGAEVQEAAVKAALGELWKEAT